MSLLDSPARSNALPSSGSDCTGKRLAYSVEEASEVTGLGRTSLYALIAAGKLARTKIGKRTLILHDELEELLRHGAETVTA